MIPEELKKLPQWAVSASSEDKAPRNPRTGQLANVNDPKTWGTYEECVASGYPLIGFMLTRQDPYAVIDLDATTDPEQLAVQARIYNYLQTYTERSLSGKGAHMWLRGSLPHGIRRDKVEVYSYARYILTNGDVVRDAPIVDGQELLDHLFAEMNRQVTQTDLTEHEDTLSDAALVEMASNAVNGEKFDRLCRGEWQGEYPSQSEADYALVNILAFYTRSNSQVLRLFRYTALGEREKAWRDEYLLRMLRKIRANEPEEVDFSALLNGNGKHHPTPNPTPENVRSILPKPVAVDRGPEPRSEKLAAFPPGFVGEIAKYIYSSSSRPVAEIATAAALSLAAGVLGRQYNISATGLNLYLIVLAKTGVGKEEATRGIDRILAAVRPQIPVVDQFVGPGTFASGPAVIRTLDERPCFVSILGEFGLTLQALSDVNASPHAIVLRRVLLDVYGKSGQGGVLRSSAYADKEKNTKVVFSPALSLFGESTPETFYGGLNISLIADGLIPRFSIMEYKGDRPKRNRNPYEPPSAGLAQRFSDLVTAVLQMQGNNTWADIGMDAEGTRLMDEFDRFCDQHIREGSNEGIRQLWNRAHLKALKIAGVLAAASNPHNPIVTAAEAGWAIQFATQDAHAITDRFESGDVGEAESKQTYEVKRLLAAYLEMDDAGLGKYKVPAKMQQQRVVTASYLQQRTAGLSAFKKHRAGARIALREVIQELIEADVLQEVPKQQMEKEFDSRSRAFYIRFLRF